jgi:hypothetical protein
MSSVGGSGGSSKPARPVVRYRFTVSTPDNRRLTSAVATVLLPPYLDGAQWSKARMEPGEKAVLSVKAPGREGETISFVLERSGPKGWEGLGSASATVKEGRAEVSHEMPSLPPPEGEAAHHEIRFRACSTDGQELLSHAVQLVPKPPEIMLLTLGAAHFGHARYTAGEVAGLSVPAHGADGHSVRFVVEKKQGEKWEVAQELRGVVEKGVANAIWAIPPLEPAGAKAEGGATEPEPAQFRFQAIADFAHSVSEPVEVAPAPPIELIAAEWASVHPELGAAFDHDDDALMRVRVSGKAEGRRILFAVQRKDGESWKPYANAFGVVRQGVAQASVRVRHPAQLQGAAEGGEKAETPPLELRFEADFA